MAQLDKALGTTTDPTDLITRAGKATTTPQARELVAEAGKAGLTALEEERKAATAKPELEAMARGKFAEEERKYVEKATTARDTAMKGAQMPEFTPNEDTLVGMATLGSLIGVIGTVLGNAGGRQSALGAIDSMSGMMAGYQQGKKNYQRLQQLEFEKNFQLIKEKQAQIQKEFEIALKKMPYDLAGARQEMEVALAKAQSPLLDATYRKQGAEMTYKIITDTANSIAKAEDLAQKASLAREKVKGKPLADKQTAQIVGLDSIATSLEKLKQSFKEEYASLGLAGFGAELSLEAKRRGYMDTEEGKNAVKWWSEYNRLQAPNRHALFGATLTGNELKNYQSFTAKPSDSADTIRGMLQGQIDYSIEEASKRRFAFESAGYQVPEVNVDFLGTYQRPVTAATGAPPVVAGTPEKPMPTGTKLKAYADENFAGNIEDAKTFLSTQGYR